MSLVDLARRFTLRRIVTPREGYAIWSETYPARPHNPLMEAEQVVVLPMLRAAQPSRALDVGTGTGRYALVLAELGSKVVGVDLSMPMLAHSAASTPRVCGDGCDLPFHNASFDTVCSSLMVGDVQRLGIWISEAARVLIPGGHLVYSDFHPSWEEQRPRRTFRSTEGRLFELPYFAHAMEEHLSLLAEARLVVRAIREPHAAGTHTPCVVVFHAVKSVRGDTRRSSA